VASVKVQNAKKCYFLCNIYKNYVGKSIYLVFEVVHKIRYSRPMQVYYRSNPVIINNRNCEEP